mmetsp:Transcript_14363/g.24319  ORF Transcript_14363/g.24319 Transcript_14363/m.24319 type:complete len:308 (+) Transcript_14363:332-1255(+)|eukprot:CAMPEP_0198198612 /NCGR_PEP_ID=MMETSP1445-20131203/2079_1 /TAXON_ID=36898 /ORGANISM="Pyramimonas sp., Strain CCMP2087" /LENGTH=307 /DNA_ID=CAMNT_0043868235 /DNA_START=332 /DNA_END=1255 /DNA_ORIENTATION=+
MSLANPFLPVRTFEVFIPDEETSKLYPTRLEISREGLKLWNIFENDVSHNYKLDQIDSWWYADDCFTFTIITPDGEKEIAVKSKQADVIMEALQDCVDDILRQRQDYIEKEEEVTREQTRDSPAFVDPLLLSPYEIRRGWLLKRRNQFPRTWQKRFFVLELEGTQHVLKYFAHEPKAGEASVGSIHMEGVALLPDARGPQSAIVFEAWQSNKARHRKFTLMAEDAAEREGWMVALLNVVSMNACHIKAKREGFRYHIPPIPQPEVAEDEDAVDFSDNESAPSTPTHDWRSPPTSPESSKFSQYSRDR